MADTKVPKRIKELMARIKKSQDGAERRWKQRESREAKIAAQNAKPLIPWVTRDPACDRWLARMYKLLTTAGRTSSRGGTAPGRSPA